jgi:hypothetical protein
MDKMIRTNLYLTKLQHTMVSQMSNERGITFSEMFRKIIDQYLESKSGKHGK